LGCLKFIEMIVGAINNETIILAGITGESFLASARSVTKVFRRNLISGVLEGKHLELLLATLYRVTHILLQVSSHE
jgi:hypothetical protein